MDGPQSQSRTDVDPPLERTPRRVSLPAFLIPEPSGLGDVLKRITIRAGVRPCGGCERRARALDQWIRLEPRPGGSPR